MTRSDTDPVRQTFTPSAADALLLVDVQNDFLPGGALAVAHGDEVIPPLNRYVALFVARGLPVVASRDAHPPNHCSFREQGGIWPVHCVVGTHGAEFAPTLQLPRDFILVSKATTPEDDAYSDFEDTGLTDQLRRLGVRRLWIGGLATDYCVRASVLDARGAGFDVLLLVDAIRAVEVHPGDGERALQDMIRAGAVPVRWAGSEVRMEPVKM